ncbi:MAG: hypothetical protein AB7Q00_03630 [Phycisphaerales bacterium]
MGDGPNQGNAATRSIALLAWSRAGVSDAGEPGDARAPVIDRVFTPWQRLGDARERLVVWRRGETLIVASLKKDAAVAAVCQGLPVLWMMEQVVGKLSGVADKVAMSSSAIVTEQVIESARAELEVASVQARGVAETFPGKGSLIQRLVDHPDLNLNEKGEPDPLDGRMGLVRVMHAIEGASAGKGLVLRVPKCAGRVGEASRVWTAMADEMVGRRTSVMVVEDVQGGHADVVLGEPSEAAWSPIVAPPTAVGLATKGPNPPQGSIEQARKRIDVWREHGPSRGDRVGPGVAARPGPIEPLGPEEDDASARQAAREQAIREAMLGSGVPQARASVIASEKDLGELFEDVPQPRVAQRRRWRRVMQASGPVALSLLLAGGMWWAWKRGYFEAVQLPSETGVSVGDTRPRVDPGPSVVDPTTAQATPTTNVPEPGADPRLTWGLPDELKALRARFDALLVDQRAGGSPTPSALEIGRRLVILGQRLDAAASPTWSREIEEWVRGEVAWAAGESRALDGEIESERVRGRARVREYLAKAAEACSATSTEMRGAFAEVVGAMDPAIGDAAAREAVGRLDGLVTKFEAGIGLGVRPPVGCGLVDDARAGEALGEVRARALATAAGDLRASGAGDGELGRRFDELAAVSGEEQVVLRAKIERACLAERLLAGGVRADEAIEGVTPRGLREELDGLSGAAKEAVSPAIAALDGVIGLGTRRDGDELAREVDSAAREGWNASLAVGGLERLASLGWPGKAERASEAGVLANERVPKMLVGLPDALRGALEARVADARHQMWRGLMEGREQDGANVDAAMRAKAAWGISERDEDSLSLVARFNATRWRFGQELDAIEASDRPREERVRSVEALMSKTLAAVEALGPGIARRASVEAFTGLLHGAKDLPDERNLTLLGPGSAGWEFAGGAADGSVVAYRKVVEVPDWKGSDPESLRRPQELRLEFRRLGVPGRSRVTYLATTEVSLAEFALVVSDAKEGGSRESFGQGDWARVRPLMLVFDPRTDDPRLGPRVWTWDPSRSWTWGEGEAPSIDRGLLSPIVPSPAVAGNTSRGWLRPMTRAEEDYYPEAIAGEVAAPTESMPMQYVSGRAAVHVSRLMGCRLPTSSEWKQALTAERKVAGTEPVWNVRDSRWRQQFERTLGLIQHTPDAPNAGIFRTSGMRRPSASADGGVVTEADDGYLWFAPVGAGAGRFFRHLIGNVSEYVYESPGDLERLGVGDDAAITELLGRGSKLRVIGGSALSPPDIDAETPQGVPLSQSLEGFSDVGFRVAFSAPGNAVAPKGDEESLVERARRAWRTSSYLASEEPSR